MGKKKIRTQTEEELLKESNKSKSAEKTSDFKNASISSPNPKEQTKEQTIVPVGKTGRKIFKGKIYIQASYNNTVITVADENGGVLAWSSAGSIGFNGPKKATPYAAAKVAETILEKIKKTEFSEVEVFVKGIGSGRESAIRSFASHGLNIISIKDITPIPHNGPRPKKIRRV